MPDGAGTRILIVGQAKTGTTALFYKIKQALPASTRCLFEPVDYSAQLFDFRRYTLAKVLIRDTQPATIESFQSFERKLLIVRDPRDTLVSSVLYSIFHANKQTDARNIDSLIELLEQKESSPGEVSLRQVIEAVDLLNPSERSCFESFRRNLQLYEQFHNTASGYHTVRYEELVNENLKSVEGYLGLKLGTATNVGPLVQRVTRTKAAGDWKNWLLDEDICWLRPQLEEAMHQFGYGDDWTTSNAPTIPVEHCSLYVKQLLNESREVSSFFGRVVRRLRLVIDHRR